MPSLDEFLVPLQHLLNKPCTVSVKNHPDRFHCFVFDWRARDADLTEELVEDTFGDGFPEGFTGSDDDTLIPFAMLSLCGFETDLQSIEYPGQFDAMWFVDMQAASDGTYPIVEIQIDGTAMVDDAAVIAQSAAELEIALA